MTAAKKARPIRRITRTSREIADLLREITRLIIWGSAVVTSAIGATTLTSIALEQITKLGS